MDVTRHHVVRLAHCCGVGFRKKDCWMELGTGKMAALDMKLDTRAFCSHYSIFLLYGVWKLIPGNANLDGIGALEYILALLHLGL